MKFLLALFLFAPFVVGLTNVTSCGILANANEEYDLNVSIDTASAPCITIVNSNITFDCKGFYINSSGNGNLISVTDHDNGTIENCVLVMTANTGSIGVVHLFGHANGWNITKNRVKTTGSNDHCFWFDASTTGNNTLDSNVCITTSTSNADGLVSSASYCNITNNVFNVTTYGAYIRGASFNRFENNSFNNNGTNNVICLDMDTTSSSNNFTENFFNASTTGFEAVRIGTGSASNWFWNNTFHVVGTSKWLVMGTSTNFFNTTSVGNVYYLNNESLADKNYSIFCLGIGAPCWANSGLARPFNSTNVPSYWSGTSADWFPWTTLVNSTFITGNASNKAFLRGFMGTAVYAGFAESSQTNRDDVKPILFAGIGLLIGAALVFMSRS